MKRRRGIFIGIALLVTVTVVVLALAFSSGVQTGLARRVLSEQPGLVATVERVDVGWSTVRVEGLTLRRDGVDLRVPNLEATLPVWRLLNNDVRIGQLVARGWEVRLDQSAGPPAPQTAQAERSSRVSQAGWNLPTLLAVADTPAAGLEDWLQSMQLPVSLELQQLDLAGNVVWREIGPGADGHAAVQITGGGLGGGRTGHLQVRVEAEGEKASAAGLQSLHIDADLGVAMTDGRTLDELSMQAALTALREGQVAPKRFNLALATHLIDDSPRLELTLSDERVRLVGLELHHETGETSGFRGSWSVSLDDAALGSLMLGRTLPGFAFEGHGNLAASADLLSGSIDGQANFSASNLDVIQSELAGVGTLQGHASFDGEFRESGFRLTTADLTVAGAAPVFTARLLQGVEVARETGEVRVASPAEPVVALDLLGVPLSWAQPWLEPLVLDARPIKGGVVGLVTSHGLRVVTTDDIVVPGLVVAQEGRTLLDEVDVAVRVGAEVTPEGWQVELDRLDLSDAAGPLFSVTARGGRLTRENDVFKMAGRFGVDLRTINRVPLLAAQVALHSGRVDGEFGVGLEEKVSVAATLAATQLVLDDGQVMPEMQFDGRVDLLPDGAIEAHLPMRFTQEDRVSDLTLNVSATPSESGWVAEGSLSGPRAYVSDLQGLGLVLAAAPVATAESLPISQPGVPATQPIWAGWTGTLKTAIGQLFLPNGLALANLRGDIVIEEDQVNLSDLSAAMESGGEVKVEGGLGFDSARSEPYEAKGALQADGVDVGAILRLLDPTELPPMEGRINVTADFGSAVSDFGQLVDNANLNARVTSAGGTLRALQVDVQQYIEAGRTLATVGGLFAALSGNERVGQQAKKLQALTQVADQLAALNFDQLNLELNRAPGGNFILRDLAVISPGVRLLGNGSIEYEAETPIWLAPLVLTLELAAREEIGDLLAQLNLLQADADALGYRPLVKAVNLDGSMAHVGTTELTQLLSRALR